MEGEGGRDQLDIGNVSNKNNSSVFVLNAKRRWSLTKNLCIFNDVLETVYHSVTILNLTGRNTQ